MVTENLSNIINIDDALSQHFRQFQHKIIDVTVRNGRYTRGELVDIRDGLLFIKHQDERQSLVRIRDVSTVYEIKRTEADGGL